MNRFCPGRVLLLAMVVAGMYVAARADDEYGDESASHGPSGLTAEMLKATDVIAKALELAPPRGWTRDGTIERYVPENMYDKINGRSELYMAYDVVGLAFTSFANESEKNALIDIYLYDMGSTLSAFGIFSVERSGAEKPVDLGREAYRSGSDLIFWKGRYYATLLGPGDSADDHELLLNVGRALAARLDDTPDQLWGLEVLPEKDRVDRSVQYYLADALSLDFLSNTFTAEYRSGTGRYKAFVSRQSGEDAAQSVSRKYAEYLEKYAAALEESHHSGVRMISADVGAGHYDVVFHTGGYVAGVTAVPDRKRAIDAAVTLLQSLRRSE